jgi:hypothetical protein
MEVLFDQQAADQEIIGSLINTNRVLWRELERTRNMLKLQQQYKQGTEMQKKILQDLNGGLVIAKEFEELTYEEAMKLYEHIKENLAVLEKFLFKKDATPPANGGDNGQTDQGTTDGSGQPQQQDGQPAAGSDPMAVNPPATNPAEAPVPPADNPAPDQPAPDQSQVTPPADPNQAQPEQGVQIQ